MSLTLTRQPNEVLWTSGSEDFYLCSIIVSDEYQYLVGMSVVGDFSLVSSAQVVGGATYTTAFDAISDNTVAVVFPHVSRFTLEGETSPGHDAFYIGQSGHSTIIPVPNVLQFLRDQGLTIEDISPASVTNELLGYICEETVNDLVIQRSATSYDKYLGGTRMLSDDGVPVMVLESPAPTVTTAVQIYAQSGETPTLYSAPEDTIINTFPIRLCWPPSEDDESWVVTGSAARHVRMYFKSVTSSPPTDNSYLALYGGEIASTSTPIPNDRGSPVIFGTEDGFITDGPSSSYVQVDGELVPFISFPSNIAELNASLGEVFSNSLSYVQLIPMKVIVPAAFSSDDPLFAPYASQAVSLTVGQDVYLYNSEMGGFVIDFTNQSTRSLVSITNVTLSGSISVEDESGILSDLKVNGMGLPFSPVSIPLNNVPTIVFTGTTKTSNSSWPSEKVVVGGIAAFVVIGMILTAIAISRS